MTEEMPENFDGFILPDGEMVSIEDVDRMFSFIVRRTENRDEVRRFLQGLFQECADNGRFEAACAYLERVLALLDSPDERAGCLLQMGQVREMSRDYKAAAAEYSRSFELPRRKNETWYFLNNNLGYCLNQEHRHQLAEKHCRAAIKIDPERHNAHKNLGVALEGQGRYADAAHCFIRATELCPTDPRALGLLENLVALHREILEEDPDLLAKLHDCHEEVQSVRGALRPQ
jgi:tetratricopeptide (TPR) repeat protein